MKDYHLRIYYEDTDAQGVVYYANYLKFFERARTEYLREVGYEQMKLMQEGIIFIVRSLELKLMKPAKLDDTVKVRTELSKLGKVIFDFKQTAYVNDSLISEANIKSGCLDSKNFTPSAIPISSFHMPGGKGVRVDSHVYAGYEIPPYYDSLLGKLIVHSPDRKSAINRMERALEETIIEGPKTTIPFHQAIMKDEKFRSGNFDTNFLKTFNYNED